MYYLGCTIFLKKWGEKALKQKRVLVISQHYWPEQFRITDICEGFAENDIQVDVLCGLPNYPTGYLFEGYSFFKPRKQQKNGVNIFRSSEVLRKNNSNARIFLNYISYPITASFKVLRFIFNKYDAVFCYETSPVLMIFPAIVFAKLKRIPLTTYVLDLWPECLYTTLDVKSPFLRKVATKVSHWHYRRCDKLIAMSDSLKQSLYNITKTVKKRKIEIYTIPQYCESIYEQQIFDKQLQDRLKGKFNIMFAGNFSPAQNLTLLCDVAVLLKQNKINDVNFVMLGSGMSYDDFINYAKQNEVLDYFTMEGQKPITDMPKYQTAVDALYASCAPSVGIIVPAKVTSYIAAAKPILLSMDGEGAKIVNEINCGLVSKPNNAEQLYENILNLKNMTIEQRKALGDNAKAYHEKYLKRDILLQKLINAIFE